MNTTEKNSRYETASKEIASVLEGESSRTAQMATISCLLSQAFDHFDWTGFYIVDPDKRDELVVGPYQGTLGCLRIPFGKGVCGTAAKTQETQVVDDVHEFDGHIACDANSRSEIVVPVLDKDKNLIAVLDVDSYQPAMFDQTDKTNLEKLMQNIFAR